MMQSGDFGTREVFFLLLLMTLAVVLSWGVVLLFSTTVGIIGSFFNLLGFGVWLMLQGS